MISLQSKVAECEQNNFNLMRLLLALVVIFSHSYPITLGPEGDTRAEPILQFTHHQTLAGPVAVDAFFLISGFLITASWLRSKSFLAYFLKRVLRIYPGFIVAMGFSAALIWALCPEFRATVVRPQDWLSSFFQNLLLLSNSSITGPGIFSMNPSPRVVNGPLWTIPIEFFCYLLVLFVGLCGLFQRRRLILGFVSAAFVLYTVSAFNGNNPFYRCLICFSVGATAWLWQDKIPFSKRAALGCAIILLAASQFRPWFLIAFPICGSYCLIWLAYGPRLSFSGWTDKTDLSYGTYLYGCPVQQLLAMNIAWRQPWINFGLAVPLTLCVALLSWHLVERPFLAMKKRLRKSDRFAGAGGLRCPRDAPVQDFHLPPTL